MAVALRSVPTSPSWSISRRKLTIARKQAIRALAAHRAADEEIIIALMSSMEQGIARRLIPALVGIDLPAAVRAMATLELVEPGTRRRLAETLETYEQHITDPEVVDGVCSLLTRCLTGESELDWKTCCRECYERLTSGRPRDPNHSSHNEHGRPHGSG